MYASLLLTAMAAYGLAAAPMNGTLQCDPSSISRPSILGAEITGIKAIFVSDYAATENTYAPVNATARSISFCNVTITHTHPGWNDSINTQIWLPQSPEWNGRFMGIGGGGWAGGKPETHAGPVSEGYAAAVTDSGRNMYNRDARGPALYADPWALLSPGTPNWPLIQDLAAVSLDDMAKIGKAVTESYYGTDINYSYWNGCSQGGRQGLMNAQRFPEHYDGILALAPAINWNDFLFTDYWTSHAMQQIGYFPPPCEMAAYTDAIIAACDTLDGVADDIISAPRLCAFNPHTIVGTEITCAADDDSGDSTPFALTSQGADVMSAFWTGMVNPANTSTNPSSTPKNEWYGYLPGSNALESSLTTCFPANDPTNCTVTPFSIAEEWMRLFLLVDPEADISAISTERFFELLQFGRNQWDTILGTRDPNLNRFKSRGGKMITWHGTADDLIAASGSADYYSRVQKLDPELRDFYRYFEVPGAAHCIEGNGRGVIPWGAFDSLVDWVENGVAPEWLVAQETNATELLEARRKVCQWPQVAVPKGAENRDQVEGWDCVDGFGYGGVGGGQTVLESVEDGRAILRSEL